jgi:hypothetical protein
VTLSTLTDGDECTTMGVSNLVGDSVGMRKQIICTRVGYQPHNCKEQESSEERINRMKRNGSETRTETGEGKKVVYSLQSHVGAACHRYVDLHAIPS